MGFSHKSAIIAGTAALEDISLDGLSNDHKMAFRKAMHKLNPEMHECNNDECEIETWKGFSDNCPACNTPGEKLGRLVK